MTEMNALSMTIDPDVTCSFCGKKGLGAITESGGKKLERPICMQCARKRIVAGIKRKPSR